jgi:dienelactone hydrolase
MPLSLLGLLLALQAPASEPPSRMQATPAMFEAPHATDADGFHTDGLRAVYFDGLPWKGQPTRVFAWIGLPKVEPGQKVPGIVLVHGGGGTAFEEWVRLWVGRGYAAIAMDTCGAVPKGTYGKWERHPHGGPPGWGGMDQLDLPVEDQWTYHAVADVLLAHSLLRAQPGVDPDRIGLTGISWGGYLTCIASGLDPRFKCAAPVYGCGFLGDDSVWAPQLKQMGDRGQEWLRLWDPSHFLPAGQMPKLWVTGTNDFAYPISSLQKSYNIAGGSSALCIRLRMPHGHGGAGENPSEILAFADSILRAGPPLPRVTGHGIEVGRAWASYEGTVSKAELLFTRDSGPWPDRQWEALPAELGPTTHRASAPLPEGVTVFYLNLIDASDRVVSSSHLEIIH